MTVFMLQTPRDSDRKWLLKFFFLPSVVQVTMPLFWFLRFTVMQILVFRHTLVLLKWGGPVWNAWNRVSPPRLVWILDGVMEETPVLPAPPTPPPRSCVEVACTVKHWCTVSLLRVNNGVYFKGKSVARVISRRHTECHRSVTVTSSVCSQVVKTWAPFHLNATINRCKVSFVLWSVTLCDS